MNEEISEAVPADRDIDELLQLALEVADTLDTHTVIERVLERALRISSAERGTLSSISGGVLSIEASVGNPGTISWIGRRFDSDWLMRQPTVTRMLETKKCVFGGRFDVSQAADVFKEALLPVQHTALIPLLHRDSVVGMLVLSRFEDVPFREGDIPRLTALGSLAGLALRNAQAFADATATARRLHAAIDAAAYVSRARDLPDLLDNILRHAVESVSAEVGVILSLADDGVLVEATWGASNPGNVWPADPSLMARLRTGTTISFSVPEVAGPFPDELKALAAPYGSAVAAPLRIGGELTGVLVLVRAAEKPHFDREEIASSEQFGSLAALLLRNARLVQDLRNLEKAKRELIDIAVHELRGPLTVIEGYASLLQDGSLGGIGDAGLKAVTTIRDKAGEARTLATDLLTLARLEGDGLTIATKPLEAGAEVAAAVTRARPRAELRGGSIGAENGEEVRVRADPELLGRILDTLLGNAINYSVGTPQVSVQIRRTAATVTVSVTDRGRGVPREDADRIFERFVRGSDVRDVSGSGLGLYLARECARRMQGDVELVESTPGAGSTFALHLPVAEDPAT